MKIFSKNKDGFTLIELLVVIAIISLLSSVVFSSLNTARAKARDARRIADLKQVQLALQLYYEKYNVYPAFSAGVGWGNDCSGFRGNEVSNNDFMRPLVDEGFLGNFLQDPKPGWVGNPIGCDMQYRDDKSGQAYRLLFKYETQPSANDSVCAGGWSCFKENYP